MAQPVRRASALLLVAAALWVFPANGNAEGTPAPKPPVRSLFLDADGDGIDDLAAIHHLSHSPVLRRAFAHHRQVMLARLFSALPEKHQAGVEMFLAAMRDDGVLPDEIHARLGQALEESGLAVPEGWYDSPEEFTERCLMSSAQHAEVSALVRSLKASGGTYLEIRQAVLAKYHEWHAIGRPLQPGVQIPPQTSDAGCTPCGSAPSNKMYEEGE